MYHWKRYLDNMQRTGMDTVVLWHDHVPAAAAEIQTYARRSGIRLIWGFNWSWNHPICLNDEEDAAYWRDKVLRTIADEYAPLAPDGIYFQIGGTEVGQGCRQNCEVCRRAREGDGVGPLVVKFTGPIIEAIHRRHPNLEISAGMHLGGIHQSYKALAAFDPSVALMWEDLPGPGKRLEIPFAYRWVPETAPSPETLEMARAMCTLRGAREDVAFVLKGFYARWGGGDPMLLSEAELEAKWQGCRQRWRQAAESCQALLPEALKVLRIIAESPARRKTVLLLVEDGLWEYRREYAALLVAEAMKDPWREADEIIAAAKAQQP